MITHLHGVPVSHQTTVEGGITLTIWIGAERIWSHTYANPADARRVWRRVDASAAAGYTAEQIAAALGADQPRSLAALRAGHAAADRHERLAEACAGGIAETTRATALQAAELAERTPTRRAADDALAASIADTMSDAARPDAARAAQLRAAVAEILGDSVDRSTDWYRRRRAAYLRARQAWA